MELKYIDISEHQKKVDFKKIKEDGVQGVILRCGYTGYGTAKSKQKDSRFEEYYKGFTEVGLPIGVYWYSCAVTEEEAIKEANLTLEYIKDKKIELPVFFDTEDNHNTKKYSPISQYTIGRTKLTKVTKAFCETIENAGYYVGIYASTSWLNNQLNMNDLKAYDVWVAQYSSKCQYKGNYGMWQYSSKGKVNGISGNVDMNKCYKDYPAIIKNAGLNGFTATKQESKPTPPASPKKTVEELANEVIADKWGTDKTNPTRKERLTSAGYNYSEVQAKVNELLCAKKTVTYTVQKGDYLVKIGKKFNVNWKDIAKLNNIKGPFYIIHTGQVLKIK